MIGWDVPKLWEGGQCWIIGGGPSITREFNVPKKIVDDVQSGQSSIEAYSPYFKSIHNQHVIGVNAAFLLGSWIDIAFFGDGGFYLKNRRELEKFPNLIVTCDPKHKEKYGRGVKFTPKERGARYGISPHRGRVSWNGNSGAAAISLAYHLGAKRIYLLGFDMRLSSDYKQHWHRHYKRGSMDLATFTKKKFPFDRHLKGFPQIAKDARRLKLEIINVNPESAINVFPKVSLKDII